MSRNLRPIRSDVNFAVSGATTGALNLVDRFQPTTTLALQAVGLDTGGLAQQLHLAVHTLADVAGDDDVFWVWAGANSYLAGERDPSVPVGELHSVLSRLYLALGARRFVVPNLFALGFFPVLSTLPPQARATLDELASLHNHRLAEMLARFESEHPDLELVPVDMHRVFDDMLAKYTNVSDSWVDLGLPAGESASGWLFFDGLHLERGVARAFGAAAAESFSHQTTSRPVRRVITLGDSLSDTGSYFDRTSRALPAGVPASPPYYRGRFGNGPLAVDEFERLVTSKHPSRFFRLPHTLSICVTAAATGDPRKARISQAGHFYLPKWIECTSATTRNGADLRIQLQFDDRVATYTGADDDPNVLCLEGHAPELTPGRPLAAEEIAVTAPAGMRDSLTVELLYYPNEA